VRAARAQLNRQAAPAHRNHARTPQLLTQTSRGTAHSSCVRHEPRLCPTRQLPAPPLPRSDNAAVHRARAPLNSEAGCAKLHTQFLPGTAAALRLVQQTVKCLLPMAAMCGQGVRARAAKAMRKRQAKYRSRCSVRSPRATHRPRRGRPFASPLRRGGKTSGVGRRDRRNTVRQWLAQCGQLARSSAAPRGSRVHAGAKAALRGLSTRSELARTARKSSSTVGKHGQFLP